MNGKPAGWKAGDPMGAGKPRVAACAGPGAPGLALLPLLALTALLALLASGCASTSPLAAALALGPTPSPATATATATVTPQTVPELGSMSYGTFPASKHGMDALVVCEQWAALRGEYVGRLRADTPYELEQWFSGRAWRTAFQADRPLKTDPNFSKINAAFGLVSTGAAASAANAKLLDEACASAD